MRPVKDGAFRYPDDAERLQRSEADRRFLMTIVDRLTEDLRARDMNVSADLMMETARSLFWSSNRKLWPANAIEDELGA